MWLEIVIFEYLVFLAIIWKYIGNFWEIAGNCEKFWEIVNTVALVWGCGIQY